MISREPEPIHLLLIRIEPALIRVIILRIYLTHLILTIPQTGTDGNMALVILKMMVAQFILMTTVGG